MPTRRRRRTRLAAVAVASVVAVMGGGCREESSPSAAPTSSAGPATSASSEASLTFIAGLVDAPPPGPRPDQFVAVNEHGVVVVVDVAGGTVVRELAHASDPTVAQVGESAQYTYVRRVALSLDQRTVYYSVSPEPACGYVSDVPIAGGDVESRGDGEYVAPGPLGYYVTSGGCSLSIRKGATVLRTMATPAASFLNTVAWSPDGRYIAVKWNVHDGEHLVMVLDLTAPDPWASATEIRGRGAFGPQYPAFRNDGRLVVVEQPEGETATARVLDPTTGALVTTFSYGGRVTTRPTTQPTPGCWSPWMTVGCAGSAAASRATWGRATPPPTGDPGSP
jgi:hypothetical protein